MKINKIVAAAAAASLAVTSLASVASAKNPRTWSLVYNYGVLTANPRAVDRGGSALGTVDQDARLFSTGAVQGNLAATKMGLTEAWDLKGLGGATYDRLGFDANADGVGNTADDADTNGSNGIHTSADFDAVIPVYVKSNTDALIGANNNEPLTAYAGALKVVVKGRKRDNANFVAIEKKTELQSNISKILSNGSQRNLRVDAPHAAIGAGANLFTDTYAAGLAVADADLRYFPLYVTNAPENMIMPTDFDAVDSITVDTTGMKAIKMVTYDEAVYFTEVDQIATGWDFDFLRYVRDAAGEDTLVPYDWYEDWYYDHTKAHQTTGVATVEFIVPDLWDAATNKTYMSAIQLTADSDSTADGLVMYGEYVANAAVHDNTKGGQILDPTQTIVDANWPAAVVAPLPTDANGNITDIPALLAATYGNLLVEKICDLVDGIKVTWAIDTAELGETNAWLPVTDIYRVPGTLYRDEIWLLSDTDDYNSLSHRIDSSVDNRRTDWADQTYNVTDYRVGTLPYGFGGLASQVADYFNKELNGTITFTFVDVTTLNGRQWLNGGIPSTEVGLRNVLTGATPDDFALYFNYATTTGSLETVVDIDVDAGEVTFDISNILDALGGYTVGTIHDIYYGMTKGTSLWNGNAGMWVSQVTLRAEDNADVSGDATAVEDTTVADDDDDDVTVEDDDDLTIEDDDDVTIEDDDDVTIEDDDDIRIEDDDTIVEDDDDAQGEIEIVSGDDDANPHTGVALAVVPALVAAAAMVVSKKRK